MKKIASLMMIGVLMLNMVGCNANIKLFGKEIFSVQENQEKAKEIIPEQEVPEEKTIEQNQYSEEQILSLILTGNYTLTIDEMDYVYNTEEILNVLFDNAPQYEIKQDQGTRYLVRIYKDNNYVTFSVDTLDNAIRTEEFCFDRNYISGVNASNAMAQYLYDVHFNEEDATLTKKHHTTKEETKKGQEKSLKEKEKTVKNEKKYNCQWCGNAMNQYQYDMWGGCCSELCAVQREGAAYEEAERNGEVGGQTLCGWCEKPIPDDQCFCSKECKNMHDEFYNN